MEKKQQESNNLNRIDHVKFILKVCIVIGMLIAAIGISIFTYVLAYPAANVLIIPSSQVRLLQVSTWLIISGMIIVFVFGTASQIASCMKRRYRDSSHSSSLLSKKESSIGTGYNPVTSPTNVDENTVWARSPISSQINDDSDNEESLSLLGNVSAVPFSKPQKTQSLRINFSDSTAAAQKV
jgi:hypothetical protein